MGGAELFDDSIKWSPRASDETQSTEQHDDYVLDQHTDPFGVGDVVPVSAALDERGESQPERR